MKNGAVSIQQHKSGPCATAAVCNSYVRLPLCYEKGAENQRRKQIRLPAATRPYDCAHDEHYFFHSRVHAWPGARAVRLQCRARCADSLTSNARAVREPQHLVFWGKMEEGDP